MAAVDPIWERIAAVASELLEELGEVDDSVALSWLDAFAAAAMAGRKTEDGCRDYRQWSQHEWAGQTTELITVAARQSEKLGPPDKDESKTFF